MFLVLKEIRDFLRTGLLTAHVAGTGTTTTIIKITAHGLRNGDEVVNVTRGNAVRIVTVTDADTLTVDLVTGQVPGDAINFPLFKKLYVGRLNSVPTNYLPSLSIYGNDTTLTAKSTATDKSEFTITIEVFINAFEGVSQAELVDDILINQRLLQNLMEERDANGVAKTTSVWGQLRRHIQGVNYLFNNDLRISYDFTADKNKTYYKAAMTLTGTARFALRS